MGEIVQFPKQKANSPPQNLEEVMATIETSRKDHIELFMDTYMPILFQSAYNEGFDLTKEECNHINSLFVESFRAGLYQSVGIPHELQTLAKDSVEAWQNELDEEEEI